jgi:ATP synthase protein I
MQLKEPTRRRVMVLTTGFLIMFLIMAVVTPYHAFFGGLLLGATVSLYNYLYLSWKVRQVIALVQAGARAGGNGIINRFLAVAAATLIAAKFPGVFDIKGVLIGLLLCYVLSILSYFTTPKAQRG